MTGYDAIFVWLLSERIGATEGDLARVLGLTARDVTQVIGRLEDRGLVARGLARGVPRLTRAGVEARVAACRYMRRIDLAAVRALNVSNAAGLFLAHGGHSFEPTGRSAPGQWWWTAGFGAVETLFLIEAGVDVSQAAATATTTKGET